MWIWLTTLIAILAMVLVGLALNFTNTNLSRRSTVPREIDKDAVSYRRSYIWILLLLVVFLIGLSLYHWPQLQYQIWTMPIIILSFVWMVLTIIVAHCNKTYRESPRNLHTTLVLPVYNEAPETLVAVLDSITRQTHRPNVVFMVDDGSTNFAACRAVFEKWRRQAKRRGIVCHYRHTASNNAKREAQAIAFRKYIDKTDIFITIDSAKSH